jgi:sugar phosphate isomerase/epimerase
VAQTRTGNIEIGFRRGWSDWQKDLQSVIEFAKSESFNVIDLGNDADESGPQVLDAGLKIGSVDLPDWQGMISPDKAKRDAAVARNTDYIRACGAFGSLNHFVVMLPENPGQGYEANFKWMVESYNLLAPVLEEHSARLVIEGWPGPGALCCNPEGCRLFFEECSSPAFGFNYDPSHLIRMGIDPIRFLHEFSGRIYHVHGKDTELFPEGVYEFGYLLEPIQAEVPGFGSTYWRYSIPGHGQMRWSEAFRVLSEKGYQGFISIELEDGNFNGTEAGEKQGLILGRRNLESC